MTNAQSPGWRAWLIWVVAVAAYILSITNRTSLAAVGVDAAEFFHAEAATLSLFAVLQLAVYGIMQIPVGLMLDRHGARPIIAGGMILMALGQAMMAFAPNVGVAIVARMLLGAGDAAVFPSALRLVSTWFPAQRVPVLVQFTGIIGQTGQLVSLLPLAALLHATTWSIAFGSLAGLGVLFTILTWAVIRNRPPERVQDVSVNTDTGTVRIVKSSFDLRQSLSDAWQHPGTRLGFWSHFTTPFAGTAFVMLWGVPFLTAGEGLTAGQAYAVTSAFVVFGMLAGPILGALSAKYPLYRSYGLVIPTVVFQLIAWVAVICWPGPAPIWLLFVLVFALATGGPASMIAFDHARAHNPMHRLSTATGIVNAGGFVAALIAIYFIGLMLDLQGAGSPDTYTLDAFRNAFLVQIPLWAWGTFAILRNRKKTRRLMGLD